MGFSYFLGIGPHFFKKLIEYFGSIKNAYKADKKDLNQVLGNTKTEKFCVFRNQFNFESELKRIKNKQITIITQESSHYPHLLKEIPDPPICLYVRGNNLKLNNHNAIYFSVVGTRKPTSYGKFVTHKIVSDLCEHGIQIVSGMAIGIDAIAHQIAFQKKVTTIAVLGCGVDIIYPSIHRTLYEEIINSSGVIVSEFPPGTRVVKGMFIARNRIISGLSCGVLVVEGLINSGTLITARYAAHQGRDVFAVPSPITSSFSEAPNLLLKQGAKLVMCAKDILDELGVSNLNSNLTSNTTHSSKEEIIIELLKKESKTVDEIIEFTQFSISETLEILSMLEIDGFVLKTEDGKYQKIGN